MSCELPQPTRAGEELQPADVRGDAQVRGTPWSWGLGPLSDGEEGKERQEELDRD